ncbi:MAG TPA: NAD(P)/FAD-dependent oxidoreductase [Longimicrobiales bacterium]|nr:NAD(P)/FAD-dependent oxidoreductase [Longimicrobiales bacterium]
MCDVVIVGAGCAGLAAAAELRRAGVEDVTILEARTRIGGRIHTLREAGVAVPVELGAEMVHGAPDETLGIVDAAGLLAVELAGRHYRAERGRVAPADDFFRYVAEVMRRLDPDVSPDRPVAEALDAPGLQDLPEEARRAALRYVEGFHAAEPERMSARVLAEAEAGGPGGGQSATRILDGYDRVPEWLAAQASGARLRLGTVARRIEWRKGAVTVRGADRWSGDRTVDAAAAVVTVPVGVLAAGAGEEGAVAFEPPLPEAHRRALAHQAMGSVAKVVFRFSRAFWTDRLEGMSFLHLADGPFEVWWSTHPVRAPLLVAWSGGPGAAALAATSESELQRLALHDLAAHLGMPAAALAAEVEAAWHHDWTRDPFARGAYSYTLVGGEGSGEALARPIEGTVFLAGEAMAPGGRSGTVDGAIASGRRAARHALAALGRR